MKKIMTAIAVTTMLLTTGGTVLASSAETIDVIATNKKMDFNKQHNGVPVGKPFINDNRTFIPVRVVSEDLGYKVDWNQKTQAAIVSKGSNVVEIKIGDNYALVNGIKTYIDIQNGKPVNTKAQLKNSRTYVPVRFISETMGDEVEYRQPSTSSVKNKTVYINSDNLPVEGPAKPAPVPVPKPVPKPTSSIKSSVPIKRIPNEYGLIEYSYVVNLSNGLQIDNVVIYDIPDTLGAVRFKDVKFGYRHNIDIKEGYKIGSGTSFSAKPNLTSEDYEIIKQAFIQVHNIHKASK